ncbi:MAG: FAD-binding protein [Fimbriimonadaceae bacterium]|nr:FAD-binding protein [Alphaproteobacteria bacterium]
MQNVKQAHKAEIEEVGSILKQRFGERFSTSAAVREQHGHTTTYHRNTPPDGVVFAQSTEEVAEIVRICAERKVPIIPFGTGTSLEGQVNAPRGGISIDLTQMNNIVSVHPEDLDCTVEAGVTRKQLNEYLRDTGLFFPIDPGADASIGGMASTRASGTNAVRYGTMREVVLGVTAVMADGQIVRTARRAKKSSAGYDLTRLLVGSEGTLGVMTEITLRLSGIPEVIAGGVCPFETLEDACNATIQTIQMGIPVARIELLDEVQVAASNDYSKLSLAVKPTLFLEFHGSEASVAEQSGSFAEIARDNGGGPLEWSTDPEERNRLWAARHDAYWASIALDPGKKAIVSDVCVPISRLAECVTETKKDILASGMIGPIVGHVGDGNFHSSLMVDIDDEEEMTKAKGVMNRIVERALAMDGTCTGEHGVGEGKIKFLEDEHGPGLTYMKAIKKALDPDNIMNPGKMFDI